MKKTSDYIIVRLYNTGYADVELEGKTIYTNKEGAYSWINTAHLNGYTEKAWKRYDNGDQTYWFN